MIEDFRDGTDSGSRISRDGFLIDRNGRAEPLDRLDPRPIESTQILASIGTETLDEAPLPLTTDDAVCESRFAGTADAGDDHQPLPGDRHIEVSKVVFARPTNQQRAT